MHNPPVRMYLPRTVDERSQNPRGPNNQTFSTPETYKADELHGKQLCLSAPAPATQIQDNVNGAIGHALDAPQALDFGPRGR